MSAATWINKLIGYTLARPSARTPAAVETRTGAARAADPASAAPTVAAASDGVTTGDLTDNCVEARSAELLSETRNARRRVREYCDSRSTLADVAMGVVARNHS